MKKIHNFRNRSSSFMCMSALHVCFPPLRAPYSAAVSAIYGTWMWKASSCDVNVTSLTHSATGRTAARRVERSFHLTP